MSEPSDHAVFSGIAAALQSRVRRFSTAVLGLFAIALLLRLIGLDFDQHHFFHPDERAIGDALLKLSFHPLQLNPHFFAYGSLPFYATRTVASLLALFPGGERFAAYDGLIHTARFLSALAGALTVILVAGIGRRLYGAKTGLLAGLFLALAVLHLQTSHFAATDVTLTFFVLLTLAAAGRLANRGRLRDAALAGALTGCALATKVSAAPLLFPVAVAVFLACRPTRAWSRGARLLGVCGAATVGAFFLGEPYAFLDFHTFWRSVSEQGAMVHHAGSLPYTNQYVGTPDFLYEARELVLWGLGPFLGLAALWAAGRRLACFRRLSNAERVQAAFFVPYVILTCTFEVKFPRYLLPVYPLLALWAAAWLGERAARGRAGRILRIAVLAGTAVWALAFMAIYQRPHTFVTASHWFHDRVPAGTHLLIQDWDEGFPFDLPDCPVARYAVASFPFYDADSSGKMAKLATALSGADWVVLQTRRQYGAVTQVPGKFPYTSRAFHLLFAGDLGFALVQEVASRPALFGWEAPDELADESFSVYDHPKLLFFANTKRLPADELTRLLLTAAPSRVLSHNDILRARPGAPAAAPIGSGPGVPARCPSLVALALFAAFLELLGLAGYALLAALLPARPGLYALGKVFGFLAFVFVPWLLVSWRWAAFSRGLLLGWAALLLAAGWVLRRRAGHAAPARERHATELVCWGAFGAFLLARAIRPEIFFGEKPMDFAFLNTLMRASALPPPDPWFAGAPLSYTYFGQYAVAAFGKALAIHPGILYNLGIAAAAGLTAAAALAAGAALGGRLRTGLVAIVLALFLAPPSGPRTAWDFLFRQSGRPLDWHYFWATSRVIPPSAINEYPIWSFLFADLHAHVLAMPFTLGFVALLLLFVTRRREGGRARDAAAFIALLGLFFGALQITNGWAMPLYGALLGFVPAVFFLSHRRPARTWAGGLVREVLAPAAGVVLAAALLAHPFWSHFAAPPRNWGLERGPFARPWDFFNVWAFFLALLVPFLFVAIRRSEPPPGRRARALLGVAAVALPLSLLSAGLHPPHLGQAASVRVFTGLAGLVGLWAALRRGTRESWRLPLALAAFGLAVLTGCEVVFVWDRMNTVFKFHLETWLLFALAGAAAIEALPAAGGRAWKAAVAVTGAAALFTVATAVAGFFRLDRGAWPRGTLDGTAYLAQHAPADRGAYEWLNANVQGLPVLLEAQGPPYEQFSRYSMNTGLPTVQGWEYHVQQHGHSEALTRGRREDVAAAYTSPDEDAVAAVLRRYRVAFVVVGPLERQSYAGANLAHFCAWTNLLAPVYRNPEVTLFAVKDAFSRAGADAGWLPATEELSAPEAGAAREAPRPAVLPAGRVSQPRGLAADAAGRVWVADFGNRRVQVFDAAGAPLRMFGTSGAAPGQFNDPCGVALGPSNRVFVADTWNGRVQVFDENGVWLREWGGGLYGPRGIAVAPDGSVFVSDTGNGRVVRFSGDGRQEAEWGPAAGPGRLSDPQGLLASRDGRIWVADNGNGRLAVFDRNGAFVRAFPVPGWRRETYSEPSVAEDTNGLLWVSVPLAGEVRAYTPEGRLAATLRGRDLPAGQRFGKPTGLALLPAGRLFVADVEGQCVVVPLPK